MPLDESKLNPDSKLFLEMIRKRFTHLEPYISMSSVIDSGISAKGFNLRVEIPSPRTTAKENMLIWFCQDDDGLSLSYGDWHAHGWQLFMPTASGYYQEIEFLDFIDLIFKNRICLFNALGEVKKSDLIDIQNVELILEELTSKYSTGTLVIYSWDGTADKSISLSDLKN